MEFLTLNDKPHGEATITKPEDTYECMKDIAPLDRETCWAIHLDARLRIIERELVTMGNLDGCLVDARTLFRKAIIIGSKAVVLIHNHPSGDPSPSAGDIRTTKQLKLSGQILGIDLLDSVIIGRSGFYSFANSNQL